MLFRSVEGEVRLDVVAPVTQSRLLDALESAYPALRGTLRDDRTKERRPMMRFFACREDHSDDPIDAPLPDAVVRGDEPYLIVGAIAGG